ncbi:MAG: hypothetical protein QOC58_2262 [Mycobacterium sp.]|jgi:hypothetical protein|nr:hypothetical protein [Mycobacterium sp.]
MAFFGTQRLTAASMLRAAANALSARSGLTPQERANLYVSRTPVAVVTAPPGDARKR